MRSIAQGTVGQAGFQHHPRSPADLGRVNSAPSASVSKPVKFKPSNDMLFRVVVEIKGTYLEYYLEYELTDGLPLLVS